MISSNRVAIIIPAYNAAKTVERTIRSVLASAIPVDVFVVMDIAVMEAILEFGVKK